MPIQELLSLYGYGGSGSPEEEEDDDDDDEEDVDGEEEEDEGDEGEEMDNYESSRSTGELKKSKACLVRTQIPIIHNTLHNTYLVI